jgi:hypothetical protein
MQEQIKELVKQAGLNIDGYGYPIWGCLDGEDEKKEFLEKFAELIVRECADIAKHHVMNISTYADADFVDEQIKEHFGVEE